MIHFMTASLSCFARHWSRDVCRFRSSRIQQHMSCQRHPSTRLQRVSDGLCCNQVSIPTGQTLARRQSHIIVWLVPSRSAFDQRVLKHRPNLNKAVKWYFKLFALPMRDHTCKFLVSFLATLFVMTLRAAERWFDMLVAVNEKCSFLKIITFSIWIFETTPCPSSVSHLPQRYSSIIFSAKALIHFRSKRQ